MIRQVGAGLQAELLITWDNEPSSALKLIGDMGKNIKTTDIFPDGR